MIRLRPFFELFILSGFGAAIAVAIDFVVSGNGSLLSGLATLLDMYLAQYLPGQTTVKIAALVLILFGACSTFYFRPLSAKGAFAGGFAILAVLAIFVP